MPLLKNPHDEARARIIWGESPAEVQHWLVMDCGLTEEQAEVVIAEIRKERAFEVRRSGLRLLQTGLGILIVSGAVVSFFWHLIKSPPADRFEYTMFALGVVGILWGVHRCGKGFSHLLTGQARGSLTEMD